MSQTAFSSNSSSSTGPICKNVLATDRVQGDSLPWRLRHDGGPEEIVEEARDIAAFLYETTTFRRLDEISPDDIGVGNWRHGLELCFKLLIDKLDIAAGVYKFPRYTYDDKAPHLCERKEVNGGW